MIAQQHKIMRQVLEARGCSPEAAQRVRSDLRDAYYRRLLPAIERICSELSTPDRIHRIETLEVDLGEVPLEALESGVADKFEEAFGRELAAAIDAAPQIDSEMELFGCFMRTGTLPWWADLSDRNLLQTNLDRLIRRAPQALRRVMQALHDQESARRRIARAYPDRLLDGLAGVLMPAWSGIFSGPDAAWAALLESVGRARGHPAHAARILWWEEVLRAVSAGSVPAADALFFFRAILTRAARRLGLDYRALIADLRSALGDGALPAQPRAREITERLWRELDGESAKTRESAGADLARLLGRLERVPAFDAEAWVRLREAIGRLPAQRQAQVLVAFEAAKERASGGEEPGRVSMDELAALVRAALGHEPAATGTPEAIGEPEKDASAESSFSDSEEVYVGNAGLVILWPFLQSFFGRLGLTEEKRFRDEAAAQRAVGLLQYVAAADESPPETLLPLNKVLCGLAPDAVFDFGPDITAKEIEECDDLLAAVIQQAPILREMSIAGFRGSFLLRKGQLAAQDGNWLLRVERETHDIVLDRFPWGVHFVKLPWMQAMMHVEW